MALNTEISKQVYAYFAVSLSSSGVPKSPASLQLGAGDPASAHHNASPLMSTSRASFTIHVGNDGWADAFNICTQDTDASDGIGLPGHHNCGDPQVPYSSG
jgi:hypothetical protein